MATGKGFKHLYHEKHFVVLLPCWHGGELPLKISIKPAVHKVSFVNTTKEFNVATGLIAYKWKKNTIQCTYPEHNLLKMLYIEYSCSNLLQCPLLVSLNKTLHWLGLDVSATVKEQQ